jgi:exodeoxyribonuclease VII small subunit
MIDQDLKKLEEISKKMETPELPLEEAMKCFQEGLEIIKRCSSVLEKTELKVKEILASQDGSFEEKNLT